MYGISNSQQQGGGGGGAASYKAIKSALTSSDWQELGTRPYFVGENAMEWPIDSGTEMPMKINSSDLGIIAGQQYTITIKADAVEYSSTATAEENGGMLFLQFLFPEEAAAFVMIYDHADWEAKAPGNGSLCAVESNANSLVITKFEGEGFSTTIQATISDSAIKVNSAVTLYTNTSEKIAVGEKTNGSITLTADSIPTVSIPYNLEIVGTDTEGLFELVNGYVPAAGITDYDGLSNVPIARQNLAQRGFTPVKNTYYLHTGTTNENYTKGVIYKCVETTDASKPLQLFEVISTHELKNILREEISPFISMSKFISERSKNVSITGSSEPYLFTVVDEDLAAVAYVDKFVNLYPRDETTEQWLKDHMLSSIITVDIDGGFSFKVNTPTLPTTFNLDYVILNVIN